jgi:hypothetical protein
MNKFFVVLVVLMLPSVIQAQKKGATRWGSASIEVAGAKLHLGMTKAEVTEQLAGSQLTKIDDRNWLIGPVEHAGPTLQFTNEHLNFVSREWTTYDNDVTQALFGVVTALNGEGFSVCKVTADTKTDPTSTNQRVWISCGEKTALVMRLTMAGKTYNIVEENLGAMHD